MRQKNDTHAFARSSFSSKLSVVVVLVPVFVVLVVLVVLVVVVMSRLPQVGEGRAEDQAAHVGPVGEVPSAP